MRPSVSLRARLVGLGLAALTLAFAARFVTHVSERPRWLVPGLALTSGALVVTVGSVPRRDS
jgi:mannose/fructose/N-acetylgalactosamine-specific phosphotransferase system component IIC